MLIVQFGQLHMHNHEFHGAGTAKVHVLGGAEHQNQHDQSGEIDLQFKSLVTKIKFSPDLFPIVLFVSLILAIPVLQFFRHDLAVQFHRTAAFSLRPPSRASP
jgi:hypothetical protein